MKTLAASLLVLVFLPLAAGSASAYTCVVLIGYVNREIAKRDPGDPKVQEAKALIADAERLHYRGERGGIGPSHTESVAKAMEAERVLGLRK